MQWQDGGRGTGIAQGNFLRGNPRWQRAASASTPHPDAGAAINALMGTAREEKYSWRSVGCDRSDAANQYRHHRN